MVKHVILWTLKEELSKEEKETVKQEIKAGLEGLAGQIPGLVDIQVNIHGLASSNADLMLDSSFETEEALKGYSVHPAHVAVADGKVRPYTASRVCLDYEAEEQDDRIDRSHDAGPGHWKRGTDPLEYPGRTKAV